MSKQEVIKTNLASDSEQSADIDFTGVQRAVENLFKECKRKSSENLGHKYLYNYIYIFFKKTL